MCCVGALLRGGGFLEADRPQRPEGAIHDSPGQRPGTPISTDVRKPRKGATCQEPGPEKYRNDTCGIDPSCVAPSGLEINVCIYSQGVALGWYMMPLRGGSLTSSDGDSGYVKVALRSWTFQFQLGGDIQHRCDAEIDMLVQVHSQILGPADDVVSVDRGGK
jgi:hypothetical protein